MSAARRVNFSNVARVLVLCLLASVLALAVWFLGFTEKGHVMLHHPRQLDQEAKAWVRHHYLIAPLTCVAVYTLLSIAAAPVWPVQVLAGCGFGLLAGIFWCDLAAAVASAATVFVSRFLAADWFHRRIESKLAKLREIDEKMGHNGLLVVIAVRLLHFLPFGICNYALGLTRVSEIDVFVGTLIGALPSVTLYVTIGADPRKLEDWRYSAAIFAANILMFVPLVLRYLKPQWFKRIGIE
jgi:uncharacterized membrane protein YdjX (TVP38/TMEM64 family)